MWPIEVRRSTSVSMPFWQCTRGSAPRPLSIAETMASEVYVAEGPGTMLAADNAFCAPRSAGKVSSAFQYLAHSELIY